MAAALIRLVAPPLLFFFPGAFFLRLVCARGRHPLPRGFWEWLFLSALGSILVASWIGLVLAELSIFSLRAVLAAQALVSIGLLLAAPGARWGIPRPRAGELAWVALFACLGIALFTPPYEYVLGNWDPGTYINSGARLARRGSITYRDPVLAALPPVDRSLFYFTHLIDQRYEGGIAIGDHERAIVSPHFYHLYTVWIALFHALGGLCLSLWVNPVLGLIALAAFALAARELAGGRSASLAALLLAGSAAEIWCVRFPTAEITAQLFFWAGLFCLFRALDEDRGAWSLFAGVCFAEALLTIFTAVLVLPVLIISLFLFQSRRAALVFLIPLAAGIAHLVIQDATVCRPYFERQVEVLRSYGLTPLRLAGAGAGFLILFAILGLNLLRIRDRAARLLHSTGFNNLLGVTLVILFLYAEFIRPLLGGGADARNLTELGWLTYPFSVTQWYISLGPIIALYGALLFIFACSGRKRDAFLLITLPVCAFFIYRKMIFPSYLWAVRRYIPLAFPALILFLACPFTLPGLLKKRGQIAAACTILVLIACMQLDYTRHVTPTDYAGTVDFLARLAAPLDRGGIYVCEGSGMAAPLDCVFGLDILQLSAQSPEKCRAVEGVMGRWIAAGRRVYYISRGGWPISRALNFVPLFQTPLETDHLEYSVGAFPRRRVPVSVTARVFRVERLGESPEADATSRMLDIGEDCFGLISGFQKPTMLREKGNGKNAKRWARWTSGEAALVIPTFGSRTDLTLTIRASAGRERPVDSVPVQLFVGGQKVAAVTISRSMEEQRVAIPASALPAGASRATLKITSLTWNPPVAGGGEQLRNLGICIDWLSVSPRER
jgi:hypothetical protein